MVRGSGEPPPCVRLSLNMAKARRQPRTLNEIVLRCLCKFVWAIYYPDYPCSHVIRNLWWVIFLFSMPATTRTTQWGDRPTAWQSTVLVWEVEHRRERRVREISFDKRPQFMYICSQRGCLLLLKWSFKSLQILGSSELRGIPLTHTPFQHHTIFSFEAMA